MDLEYRIVRILQKYSSQKETTDTHPMTLTEIQQEAAKEYDDGKKPREDYNASDIPTRRMVQRAMDSLIGWELSLPPEEKTIMYREYGDPDAPRRTDYWYQSPWRDADLRFLIDSALYSGILNEKQTRELVENIKNLSGKNLKEMTRYARVFGGSRYFADNDVMSNVELLSAAIYQQKKVRFMLNVYNIKKELRPDQEHIISPFEIVMGNNAKYYLIGTYDNSVKVYFFRIDLITGINMLDEKAEDKENIEEIRNGINLLKYHNEHPYMFGGKPVRMKLRVNKDIFTQIIDWFGYDVTVDRKSETETTIDVTVSAVEDAMHYWLLQYGENVKALNVGEDFAEKMRAAAMKIYESYSLDGGKQLSK